MMITTTRLTDDQRQSASPGIPKEALDSNHLTASMAPRHNHEDLIGIPPPVNEAHIPESAPVSTGLTPSVRAQFLPPLHDAFQKVVQLPVQRVAERKQVEQVRHVPPKGGNRRQPLRIHCALISVGPEVAQQVHPLHEIAQDLNPVDWG